MRSAGARWSTAAGLGSQEGGPPPRRRQTRQRTAVFDTVCALGGHVSAEEVVGSIRLRDPSFPRSTVYRALDALAAAGSLHAVRLGEAATRYEVAGREHQHAVCRRCQGVLHLEHDLIRGLEADLSRRHGFRPERADVLVVGVCSACSAPADQRSESSNRAL